MDKEKQLCTMCSHWSNKDEWVDDKCPRCGQVLILADTSERCPNCGIINRKQDITEGKCPKCQ